MADSSSGRNNLNSGSDSAKHHGSLPIDRFHDSVKPGASTPTTGPNGSVVRDERPSAIPGSAVK
ncbi:hypothetical protein [Burkholderia sp. S171]|uniref:hypothetical protein n=1 Tax=Burkholderia sp. S171 TaxID=1641860 RepID=UPI00131B712C|nr:hypothetical protein [Burkholderia sp. S171]